MNFWLGFKILENFFSADKNQILQTFQKFRMFNVQLRKKNHLIGKLRSKTIIEDFNSTF